MRSAARGLVVAALAAPWLCAAAQATTQAATTAQAVPPAPPAPPPIPAAAIGLMLLLVLLPVAIWALRRFGFRAGAGGGGMRIVAQLGLGPRERLVAVDTGERCLLLAISPAGIARVGTVARDALASQPPTPASFAALLRHRIRPDAKSD